MTPIVSSGEGFGRVKRRPLGKGALGVSVTLHFAAFAVLFWVIPALEEPVILYEVVEVDMVAMAPAPPDELVVETPEDPPPVVQEEAPVRSPNPTPNRIPRKRHPCSRTRRLRSRRRPPIRRHRTTGRTRSRNRSRR